MAAFQYQPYRSDLTGTIAEMMQAPDRVRANALRQSAGLEARNSISSAQNRAQLITDLGRMAQNTIGGIMKDRQREQEMAPRLELQSLQLDDARRNAASADQAQRDQQGLDAALKAAQVEDPTTGLVKFDRNALQQMVPARLWTQISPMLDKSDASLDAAFKSQNAYLTNMAGLLDVAGNDPVVFAHLMRQAEQNGQITATRAQQIRASVGTDPAKIAALTARLLGREPKKLMEFDPQKNYGDPITGAVSVPASEKKPDTRSLDVQAADALLAGDIEKYKKLVQVKRDTREAGARVTVNTNPSAQEDISTLADGVRNGELLPNDLAKRGGDYNQILAKASRDSMRLTGKPLNITKLRLDYTAASRHVAAMNSTQRQTFFSLANAVTNTMSEAMRLSEALDQSGVQGWNSVKRSGLMKLFGNTDYAQTAADYMATVNTLQEEYAQLANGGYAPTEPAWALAQKQINEDFGVKIFTTSLAQSQRLINYRLGSFNNLQPQYIGGPSSLTGVGPKPGTPAENGHGSAPSKADPLGIR